MARKHNYARTQQFPVFGTGRTKYCGNTDVPEEDGFKVIPAVSNVWNLKLYAGIVTTVVLLATSFPRCFVAVVVVSFICFFWGWGDGGRGEGGRGEGLYCH